MYTCKDCNKSYPTKNSLARHAHNHQAVAQHQCNICGVEFRRRDILLRHGKIHASELAVDSDEGPAQGEARKRRRCHTACQNCRKARSKCDGELPCSSCKTSGKQCAYGQNSLRLSQRPVVSRFDVDTAAGSDIANSSDHSRRSSHVSMSGPPELQHMGNQTPLSASSSHSSHKMGSTSRPSTAFHPHPATLSTSAFAPPLGATLPTTSADIKYSSGLSGTVDSGGYKWPHPIQAPSPQPTLPHTTQPHGITHLPPHFHHQQPGSQIHSSLNYAPSQQDQQPHALPNEPLSAHIPPTTMPFHSAQSSHHHIQTAQDPLAVSSIISGSVPAQFSETNPEFDLPFDFEQNMGALFPLTAVDVPDWPWLHQEIFLRTDPSALWLAQFNQGGMSTSMPHDGVGTVVVSAPAYGTGPLMATGSAVNVAGYVPQNVVPTQASSLSFGASAGMSSNMQVLQDTLPQAQPMHLVAPPVPTQPQPSHTLLGPQLQPEIQSMPAAQSLDLNHHNTATLTTNPAPVPPPPAPHPKSGSSSSLETNMSEKTGSAKSQQSDQSQSAGSARPSNHDGVDALLTVAQTSGCQTEVINKLQEYAKRAGSQPAGGASFYFSDSTSQANHCEFWSTMSNQIDAAFCSGAGARHGRPTLERFIDLYFQHFHPLWIIVLLRPGTDPTTLPPFLYLTMASIGAMYDGPQGAACGAMLHERLRDTLMAHQFDFAESEPEPLWVIQAMALTQLAALYFGHRRAFSAAQHLGCILIAHARRMKLFSVQRYRHNHLSAIVRCRKPEQRHRLWIRLQTKVRLAFSIFRSDAYMSALLNTRPLMSPTEMEVDPHMYVFNQAKLTDMDASIEKAIQEHNKKQVIQLSDVVRIALDRRERLPSTMGPGEHEIVLFALQGQVWEYCHDPGAAARLSTLAIDPEARDEYILEDHPDFAGFEQPPDFRRMEDLRADSARLASALCQWERSFMRAALRVQPTGPHRPLLVTSLLLYQLTFIRMHAPVEALHRLSYSLDENPGPSLHGLVQAHPQDTAELLRALFVWAQRPQAATAVRHAIQIWRLIRAELSRPPEKRVRLNLMSFVGLHHGGVVVWAYAVSRTRSNTKFVLPACDSWATDAGPGINSVLRENQARRRGRDRSHARNRDIDMEVDVSPEHGNATNGIEAGSGVGLGLARTVTGPESLSVRSGSKRQRPRSWSTGSRQLETTDEEELIRDWKIHINQSPTMKPSRAETDGPQGSAGKFMTEPQTRSQSSSTVGGSPGTFSPANSHDTPATTIQNHTASSRSRSGACFKDEDVRRTSNINDYSTNSSTTTPQYSAANSKIGDLADSSAAAPGAAAATATGTNSGNMGMNPAFKPGPSIYPSFPDVPSTGIPLCREEIHALLSAFASLYEYISPTWSLKSTFAEAAWRLARREPPPMMNPSTAGSSSVGGGGGVGGPGRADAL